MSCICAGDVLPEFTYDTPYAAQNSFYALLEQDERPVFLIFLRNFGHPLTRHYVVRYAQTIAELYDARLACVVRSRPEVINENLPEGTLPYTVICDAEGVLYDYLEVPQAKNRFTAYSLEGMRILKQARKQGFEEESDAPQQLPLTLLLDRGGLVLMSHYGNSITDQPESCAAMQAVMNARTRQMEKLEKQARRGRKKCEDEEVLDEESAEYAAEEENESDPAAECDVQESDAAPQEQVTEEEIIEAISFRLEEPEQPQAPVRPQVPAEPEPIVQEQPKRASQPEERDVEAEAIRKYSDVAAALFRSED